MIMGRGSHWEEMEEDQKETVWEEYQKETAWKNRGLEKKRERKRVKVPV